MRGATQPRYRDDEKEKSYRRKEGRCYHCGKKGHFARDCWAKKEEGNAVTLKTEEDEEEWDAQASFVVEEPQWEKSVEIVTTCIDKPVEETKLATMSETINYNDDWIVDSSCSNHMTGDKGKFLSMFNEKLRNEILENLSK